MDIRAALITIHRGLVAREVEHALIGGLALSVHGAGRATTDLDWIADGHRAERVDDLLRVEGYEAIHRNDWAGNYLSSDPVKGRIDFLFVRRSGMKILERASDHSVLGETVPVAEASDLIGLKVQAYSNNPHRRHGDLEDIARLISMGDVDLARVRDYFRMFELRGRSRRDPWRPRKDVSRSHKEPVALRDEARHPRGPRGACRVQSRSRTVGSSEPHDAGGNARLHRPAEARVRRRRARPHALARRPHSDRLGRAPSHPTSDALSGTRGVGRDRQASSAPTRAGTRSSPWPRESLVREEGARRVVRVGAEETQRERAPARAGSGGAASVQNAWVEHDRVAGLDGEGHDRPRRAIRFDVREPRQRAVAVDGRGVVRGVEARAVVHRAALEPTTSSSDCSRGTASKQIHTTAICSPSTGR